MIDWDKSAKLNNCTIGELKDWFKKYPRSNKKVIAKCNNCGLERENQFNLYRDLCRNCSIRTPEVRNAARLKTIEQYSTQKARDDQSERITNHNKEHPETRRLNSVLATERWSKQSECDAQSERIMNSIAAKIEHERQRGGMDIVQHHYIYDNTDKSKYTIGITRSDHMSLHRLLQKLGYIVPHINVKE